MRRSAKARHDTSGDLHPAEDADARKRSDKKRAAFSEDEDEANDTGIERRVERNVFMVLNGRVPEALKRDLVVQRDSFTVDEVKAIVNDLPGFPVLCGADCASELEELAHMHSCLRKFSVQQGALSWHILFDERAWHMTSPLRVMEIIPASHLSVERCCGMCEMIRINSDAGQLAVRLILLKCHRGKAQSVEWHINQETRRKVAEFIDANLEILDTPTLIVGDIGMRANYLLGQRSAHNESALIYNLSRDSQIALSTPVPKATQQVRDLAQSADILIFEYVMKTSDATQLAGDVRLKVRKKKNRHTQELVLMSRAEKCFRCWKATTDATTLYASMRCGIQFSVLHRICQAKES